MFNFRVTGFVPVNGYAWLDTSVDDDHLFNDFFLGYVNDNFPMYVNLDRERLAAGFNVSLSAGVVVRGSGKVDFKNTFELVSIQYFLPDGTFDPTAIFTSNSGRDYSPSLAHEVSEPMSGVILGAIALVSACFRLARRRR